MTNLLFVVIFFLVVVIFACLWFLGTFRNERNEAQFETQEMKATLQAIKQQRDHLRQELDQAQEQIEQLKTTKKRKKKPPSPVDTAAQFRRRGEKLAPKVYLERGCVVLASDGEKNYTPFAVLYQHYLAYCEQNGRQAVSKHKFGHELKVLGLRNDRQYVDGKQARVVWGVAPKPTA